MMYQTNKNQIANQQMDIGLLILLLLNLIFQYIHTGTVYCIHAELNSESRNTIYIYTHMNKTFCNYLLDILSN